MLIDCSPAATSLAQRLQQAADALRAGRPVLLADDADRENEADLIVAASLLSVPVMAMLIREGSGIVCLCLPPDTVEQLQLPPMVQSNQSRHGTAFTVSIEARYGVSTGVSALDRLTTVRAATAPGAGPGDVVSPGHVSRCAPRPVACWPGAATPKAPSTCVTWPACRGLPCCAS